MTVRQDDLCGGDHHSLKSILRCYACARSQEWHGANINKLVNDDMK